ncbi:MAG TPA: LysM peptidoglycan-binding domain-containing protein, partial [Polyangiales bacterium]
MTRHAVLLCLIALGSPAHSFAQDFEAVDYSDYFGENGKAARDGPRSLGEARLQGRAYRLGQSGNVYRTPTKETHTVQEGDTLWDISDRYFGDPWHWPELWSYNPEITNPHWIYPLDQVRLSADALDQEQALASAPAARTAPKANTAAEFREPHQALSTDLAPRVAVPRSLMTKGTVFLRDQGYLDDDQLKSSGLIV